MNVQNPTAAHATALYQGKPTEPMTVANKFTIGAGEVVNFSLDYLRDMQGFDSVKTLYIDNADNSESVTVASRETGQSIKCPGNSQGYFPVLSSRAMDFKLSHDGNGEIKLTVFFINVALSQGIW